MVSHDTFVLRRSRAPSYADEICATTFRIHASPTYEIGRADRSRECRGIHSRMLQCARKRDDGVQEGDARRPAQRVVRVHERNGRPLLSCGHESMHPYASGKVPDENWRVKRPHCARPDDREANMGECLMYFKVVLI